MMVGSHKGSNPVFDEGYDFQIWNSDPEEVKVEKRKRQALAVKSGAEELNK